MADIYLPSFPAIAHGLNTNIQNVQFSLSIYMFGFCISQLFYGPVSDGIGRRKPMLVGLSFCFIGSILCCISQNISTLLLGRFCQGLGAGATLTLGSAMMRDLFEGTTLAKYGSYGASVMAIVLATAPLLGGYFQEYLGWHATFAFLILYTLSTLLVFIFFIPETNQFLQTDNLQFKNIKQNLYTLVTSPIFIGFATCSLLTYGAILAWLTSGPVLLEKVIGLSPVQFGWVYAIAGLAFSAGAFTNSQLVTHLGIPRMIYIGLTGMLFSGLIMLGLKWLGFMNTAVIAGPAILLLFSCSMVFPNTSAGLFQPFPHIAGITSALFYSSRLLGGAVFSALIALMPNTTQTPMALAFITSAILSWVVFYLCQKAT